MIRRQIFFGLTLVLIAVVIFLLLRGRNADKEWEEQNMKAEETQSAPSSPTRVLTPRDLKLVQANVSFAPASEGAEEKGSVTAHHDITVQNSGDDAYGGLRLRLEYLDRNGKVLVDKIHAVGESLSARETLRLEDIAINDLPDGMTDCRVSIISADLALI